MFPAAETAAPTATRSHGNVRGANYFRSDSMTTDETTTTDEGDNDSCSSNPRSLVEFGNEDHLDPLTRGTADGERTAACTLQTLIAIGFGQTEQPQTRAIALLRMRSVIELPLHDRTGSGPDLLAPVEQSSWRPFQMLLVRFRHVLGECRKLAHLITTHVHGDAPAFEEALDRGVGVTRHEVLPDEHVRNAVVMPLNIDVIVDVDFHLGPLGVLIARSGQRPHRRPVDGFERLGATARQFLERPTIQVHEQFCDRNVKLDKGEELAVAQSREDPPLHHQHAQRCAHAS